MRAPLQLRRTRKLSSEPDDLRWALVAPDDPDHAADADRSKPWSVDWIVGDDAWPALQPPTKVVTQRRVPLLVEEQLSPEHGSPPSTVLITGAVLIDALEGRRLRIRFEVDSTALRCAGATVERVPLRVASDHVALEPEAVRWPRRPGPSPTVPAFPWPASPLRTVPRLWDSDELTAHDACSIVAKGFAERSRNAADGLVAIRSRIELQLLADQEVPAAAVTALLSLANLAGTMRGAFQGGVREGIALGRYDDQAYHEYPVLLAQYERDVQDKTPEERRALRRGTWMWEHHRAVDHLGIGAERLDELARGLYSLMAGLTTLATTRDAAGQERLNRIAAMTAIVSLVVGIPLALYGADLLVPGKDDRPWRLLAVIAATLTLAFAIAALNDRRTRGWLNSWTVAAVIALLLSGGFGIAWVVDDRPPEEVQILSCSQVPTLGVEGPRFRCAEDRQIPPAPVGAK